MARIAVSLLVIVVFTSGCGGGLDMVPCRGLVTLNGKPVEQANVYFLREGEPGLAAMGVTDAQGHFELKTGPDRGAMRGRYVVTVQKDDASSMNIPDPPPGGMSRIEYMQAHNLFPRPLLPEKYSQFAETPLRVEVSGDAGKNDFELKLEGAVPTGPQAGRPIR